MNAKTILSLLFLALSATAYGQVEWRTYTSQDGARSFEGQLVAFDEQTKTVTVLNRQRQTLDFNIDVLSDKDKEYITSTASTLPVKARLDIRFQKLQDHQASDRSATTRRTESDGGYHITVNNFTPLDFRNARVEYIIIYRKDSATGPATTQFLRGYEQLDLEANGTHEFETETVELVSFRQRSEGGGGG